MATTPEHLAPDFRTASAGDEVSPHQLDFYQAMSDFKHMFPGMDEEIIEAVLRSNNGAVDATIDQLLTMNIDTEGGEGGQQMMAMPLPKPVPSMPPATKTPALLPESSSDEDESLPPYPPPSYTDYTHSMQAPPAVEGATQTTPCTEPPINTSINLLDAPISDLMAMGSNPPQPAPTPEQDLLGAVGGFSNNSAGSRPQGGHIPQATPNQPIPTLLDSDFGILGAPAPPPRQKCPAAVAEAAPPLPPKFYKSESSTSPRSSTLSSSASTPTKQRGPKRNYMNWNPPLLGNLPEDFLRISVSSPGLSTPMGLSAHRLEGSPTPRSPRSGGSSPRISGRVNHRSPNRTPGSGELSSALIQQKMAENERRRTSIQDGDTETAQMLEDERLALMLQNEEFLMELMHDEDFMRTLQRDRMNATAFEPPAQTEPELDPNRPRPDDSDDELITDGLETSTNDEILGAYSAKCAKSKGDQLEGYGDDRDKYLGAFPFDRDIGESAEFRKQLSNMGGSSKKKFAAAARRFFSRKKKKSSKTTYPYPNLEREGYNTLDDSEIPTQGR